MIPFQELCDFSHRLFAHQLLLPLAPWIIAQGNAQFRFVDAKAYIDHQAGYPTPGTSRAIAKKELARFHGALSTLLKEMRKLGLVDQLPQQGRERPFVKVNSPLWEIIELALTKVPLIKLDPSRQG